MSAEYPVSEEEFYVITDGLAHAEVFHPAGYANVVFRMQASLMSVARGQLDTPEKTAADAIRACHAAALKLCDCPDRAKS